MECTVLDERVNIQSEPATQFVVSSLGVVVNSNVSIIEKVARFDIPKENQFIFGAGERNPCSESGLLSLEYLLK